ncbi:MAG: recombinase family protein [Alistipes sp.]
MIVAYLRISTGKQHLENQQDEICRFAQRKNLIIDRWVTEIVSGRKHERKRKLGGLLRRLRTGDTLLVTELSRLSRTMTDIMTIMGECLRRKITIYSTKDGYAFDESINSKVLCFAFGLVAEIERNLISMRTKEALAFRRSEGVTLGRRKGSCTKQHLLDKNREAIAVCLRNGQTIALICTTYGVSRDTFRVFRKRDQLIDQLCNDRKKRAIHPLQTSKLIDPLKELNTDSFLAP